MSRRPFTSSGGSWQDRAERRHALRKRIFEEQKGLCWLCGEPMLLDGRSPKFASFDHVIPKSEGGTTYHTNLKLAHRKCNSARNHKFPKSLCSG